MLGNDIIDLQAARSESNWRRKGYFQKVFSPVEQEWINTSPDPDQLVWILWSIKEAVYKAHFRITQLWEFAPAKVKITKIKLKEREALGEVAYHDKIFFSNTFISDTFVHSIALIDPLNFPTIQVLALKTLSRDYDLILRSRNLIKKDQKIIKTTEGIPNIVTKGENIPSPVSISHHGEFLGIIIKDSVE